jgi:hypothetical protein
MPSFPLFGVGVFTIIDGICQEKVARFEKFLVEKTQGRFSRPAAGRADSPAVQRMVGGGDGGENRRASIGTGDDKQESGR